MENIVFIVNPKAKNGFGMKIWKKVEAELQQKQIAYDIYFTEYRGHAIEIAQTIGQKNVNKKTTVIAIGGDGTLHEVINGSIKFPDMMVGLIPGGSGNDFCRGFCIPSDPLKALNHILMHKIEHIQKIDIGKASIGNEECFFVNNMGAGFDAVVADGANRSGLKGLFNRFSLGKLVYVAILIKKLITFRCTDVEINVDGIDLKFEKVWFVTVSNQPFFGGGMKISPDASPFDSVLNITVVHDLSKIKLLAVFGSVFWGGHTRFKEVKTYKGKFIMMSSSEPLLIHLDGEIKGYTPVKVQVFPKEAQVIISDRAKETVN